MKKGSFKLLSLLLTVALLVSCFGTITVFAADEVTLLNVDFENCTEGEKIAAGAFTKVVTGDNAKVVCEKDGDSKVASFSKVNDKTSGPRFEYTFNASGLTNFTVSFRAKASDCSALLAFATTEGKTTVAANNTAKWYTYNIKFDVKGGKYTSERDDGKKDSGSLDGANLSKFTLRFDQTLKAGQESKTWWDDIKITTTDKVDPNNLPTGSASAAPAAAAAPAASSAETADNGAIKIPNSGKALPKPEKIPEKANILMQDDFESYGADFSNGPVSWKATNSGTAVTKPTKDRENGVASLGNNGTASTYPKIVFGASYSGLKDLTVCYAVKVSESQQYLDMMYNTGDKVVLYRLDQGSKIGSDNVAGTEWVNVRVEMNFEKNTYSIYYDGKAAVVQNAFSPPINDSSALTFNINSKVVGGDAVYIDNFVCYTNSTVSSAKKLLGDGKTDFSVDWNNVKYDAKDDSYVAKIKKTHPRIHLTSWDAVKQKLNSTDEFKNMYQNILQSAENLITQPATEYKLSDRSNILSISRTVMGNVYVLAFAYKMSGDTRFLNRVWEEIEATTKYQDWTPNAFLATAEMMHAYSVAYDWLYDDFTQEQKDIMIDGLKRLGIAPLVYNYEGMTTSTNFMSQTHNWNAVCNGSAIITAIAFCDAIPDICEYMIHKAEGYIQNGLKPYNPEGAYPEGPMYWTYGTNYLTYTMSAIDTGFEQGQIPKLLKLYDSPGVSETGKYVVYYNGNEGSFNFGDASSELKSSPLLFYFGAKFNRPEYAWYQKHVTSLIGNSESGTMSGVLSIIWYDGNSTLVPGTFPLDNAYMSTEANHNGLSFRSSWEDPHGLYAAMLSGYNRSNHQYQSQGTFVFESNGVRWITMRGAGNYSYTGYQSSASADATRWTYYVCRGEGQNTIIANPGYVSDQKFDAQGRVIKFEEAENEAFGVSDISDSNTAFSSALRGMFVYDNRTKMLLQDEVKLNTPSELYWFAHTAADITLSEDGSSALLEQKGKRCWVHIDKAPDGAKFEIIDAKPLITSPDPTEQSVSFGQKLSIHVPKATGDATISVEFVPLEDGEGVPTGATKEFKPISSWKAESSALTNTAKLGTGTALMINTPNAYSKGTKTYVDTANREVFPVIQNDRTLVPVRFISENFGADVGWDDATRTVTVDYEGKHISMQLGSDKMIVNGNEQTLDVAAQVLNDRTVIPLRALVESLGKSVFWDDRGLILITDTETAFTESEIDSFVRSLAYSVSVNGNDLMYFDAEKTDYVLEGNADTEIAFTSVKGESADISKNGNVVTMNVDGRAYTFTMNPNPFANLPSNKDKSAIGDLNIKFKGAAEISGKTYIDATCIDQSRVDSTYPLTNLLDNNLSTQWAANGKDQWIAFDFGKETSVGGFALAVSQPETRAYSFTLQKSDDGVNWTDFFDGNTVKTSDPFPQQYSFDAQTMRYIRIFCKGYDGGTWNTYMEVRFYTDSAMAAADKASYDAYFNNGTFIGKKGDTAQIDVTAPTLGGEIIDKSQLKYRYYSTNTSIATVDDKGLVTLTGTGKVKLGIEVTYKNTVKLYSLNVECK